MDAVGSLELEWSQGYAGQHVDFVKTGVMCFKCGNNIKIIDDTGKETMYSGPEDGLGAVTTHSIKKLFAYSDMTIYPKIHIISYPDLKKQKELKGGAKLEYVKLTFSTSGYLASISGLPEFELTIWNFQDGQKLIMLLLSNKPQHHISFNPADWHQLCTSTQKEVTLWTLEQCDTRTICNTKKLQMPKEDAELGMYSSSGKVIVEKSESIHSRLSSHMAPAAIIIPRHVVAGVRTADAHKFDEYEDTCVRMEPQHHCWTPTGEVLLGCKGGQLMKIDPEVATIEVLLNPIITPAAPEHTGSDVAAPKRPLSAKRNTKLSFGRKMSGAPSAQSVEPIPETSNNINQVALHKKGLFMAGNDGYIYHIELTRKGIILMQKHRICDNNCSITCLTFDPPHNRLAVGTRQGTLYLCNPLKLSENEMLFSVHNGNFVAVDVLDPGSDIVVSLREDGEFQVWDVETAKLLASIPIGFKVRSLSCSPLTHVAAIGDDNGFLYFVDVNNVAEPRIVHCQRMHSTHLNCLTFNENGMFLLTGSGDGHVFVIDGRPTAKFATLGHIDVPGNVISMSTYLDEKNGGGTKVVITTDFNNNDTQGASTVISLELPADLAQDVVSKHTNLRAMFKNEVIHKQQYRVTTPIYGVALTDNNTMFGLAQMHEYSKRFAKFLMPTGISQKVMVPMKEFTGHQLNGGCLKMSPHHKWVGSCGTDGRVMVRAVGALERAVDVYAHNFSTGGVSNIIFTTDTHRVITTGYDGVMSCYKWNFTTVGAEKAKQAVQEAATRHAKLADIGAGETAALKAMTKWLPITSEPRQSHVQTPEEMNDNLNEAIASAIKADEIFSAPLAVAKINPTWLELQEHEAINAEDQQYATVKHDLRVQIREMRRKIQVMMRENDAVPDIEKLSHPEFDLDLDEQLRLQANGEIEIRKIREEIEYENLAKMYLAELIKKECWDDMDTKGRGLSAFTSPLVVYNYPLRLRGLMELEELDRITQQRRIEKAEYQNRITLVETRSKSTVYSSGDEDFIDSEEIEAGKESLATIGSLSQNYGGSSEVLYSQFELHTREQKMNQIVLLKDIIHRIRETFNNEFDEVYEKKQQEMGKIKEKNKRIRKIHQDLKLSDSVIDPEFGEIERPELLLIVRDDEVKVEKYLTEEERKAKEKTEKEDAERRKKEQKDNWRERGLDDMMDGVLEMRKEDELKKDVLIPVFMSSKSEEEWSEDEIRLAAEYEKKCKDLEDEREKYRKQLEIELKKLEALNEERLEQYDEIIYTLFDRKVKSEMVIYQEEMKIMRLRLSLLLEEELDNRQHDLNNLHEHKNNLKEQSAKAVLLARRQVDAYQEKYDILLVEDRLLDKGFKKEFHDTSAIQLDHLYKMFRKRPRHHRLKEAESPVYDPASGNPFAEQPSPSYLVELSKLAMEAALQDLDKFSNAPDSIDEDMWHRLCHYRRLKIENEHMMKHKVQVLADMQVFLQKRFDEDEQLGEDIIDLCNTISKLKEDKLRFVCNLEVQLVLKQGQVELDNTAFIPDFQNSLLIHRSVIEDLNAKIRNLGEHKIASMEESKDFRKGIIQLEWEYKRMTMEMVDLQNKMRDIQNMKVTREIQSYLNQEDHEARKAHEITILEQTVDMQRRQHDRTVAERKRSLTDLKRTIRGKKDDNSQLNGELNDINVAVNERRHIHEVVADKTTSFDHDERYRDIVQRRKLVDLAKAQAQEVAVLRAEVERLRMRTFPALVQVER